MQWRRVPSKPLRQEAEAEREREKERSEVLPSHTDPPFGAGLEQK